MVQKEKINISRFRKTFFVLIVLFIFFSPLSLAHAVAHGIIPCDGTETALINGKTVVVGCTFNDFVRLAQNLINYLIFISIPLTAIAFSYAGFLMVTAAGSEEKIKQGKAIFGKVLMGFIFILSAWLIVYTITSALLCKAGDPGCSTTPTLLR